LFPEKMVIGLDKPEKRNMYHESFRFLIKLHTGSGSKYNL